MNSKDVSLLIVEDDYDNLEMLHSMATLDFRSVYLASDGCEGLELFLQYRPDIIITDIEMPCMTGLEMLEKIRAYDTQCMVIFTTAYSDTERLLEAIDLSVDAYVLKPIVYQNILDKIHSKWKDPLKSAELLDSLSKREYEIFIDIAKGVKPSDIASKYELKPKTVGTYRRRILEKLELYSNTDLIKYAITHQLI
jgi:DNA-binding NarL/FixJ family response regulator